MKELTLDLGDCPLDPVDPILLPECQCVPVDEIKANEAKVGNRVVLATPYRAGSRICSGQYGQLQVLTGFGGQIHRALYVGRSFGKVPTYGSPGVASTVDLDDCISADPAIDGGPGGDKVIAVRDRGRWYVFKATGGGTSAPPSMCGIVLGGNSLVIDEVGGEPVYAAATDQALTLPVLNEDQTEIIRLPVVDDWENYELPLDYEYDDVLPRLPIGLCYIRLVRPFNSGASSWDAYLDLDPEEDPVPAPYVMQATSTAPYSTIRLTWSKSVSLGDDITGLLNSSYWSLQPQFPQDPPEDPPFAVLSVSHSGRNTTLTLNRPYDYFTDGTLIVSAPDGTEDVPPEVPPHGWDPDDSGVPKRGTVAVSSTVALKGARFSVIVALNRTGETDYKAGDYIRLETKSASLTDELGVTKTLLDIVGICGAEEPALPTIFEVIAGEDLIGVGRVGIKRVSPDVVAGDLPDVTIPPGIPAGGVYVVPAWPVPTGLPSGVGVGRQVPSSTYGFLLNDTRASIYWDVVQMDRVWTPETITIDKAVGLKTARWILNIMRQQV